MTNTLNRRSMLRATLIGTSAMLSTAALAAAAALVFAFPDDEPVENPELLALGNKVTDLEAKYIVARRARSAAITKGDKLWPVAPDALSEDGFCYREYMERDITGYGITRPGERSPRRLTTSEDINTWIKRIRDGIRRKRNHATPINVWGSKGTREEWEAEMGKLYALLVTADAYEADMARARKLSGYTAARKRFDAAEEALKAGVVAVMAQQETTAVGLLVKARALKAWGKLDPVARLVAISKHGDWSAQFAASVERFMEEEAAWQA